MLDEIGGHEKYSSELKENLSNIREEMIESDTFDIDQEFDSEI